MIEYLLPFLIFPCLLFSIHQITVRQRQKNVRKVVLMVSGYKGSGKDTLAVYLIKKYGFVRFAFADKLKDICAVVYDIDREDMDNELIKEKPILHRPVISRDTFAFAVQPLIYTHFRTEDRDVPTDVDQEKYLKRDGEHLTWKGKKLYWTPRAILVLEGSTKRTVDPNYWVRAIDRLRKQDIRRIVNPDWRYENEYRRVQEFMMDYQVIPIRIDTPVNSTTIDDSERGLDKFSEFVTRVENTKCGLSTFFADIERIVVPTFMCKK